MKNSTKLKIFFDKDLYKIEKLRTNDIRKKFTIIDAARFELFFLYIWINKEKKKKNFLFFFKCKMFVDDDDGQNTKVKALILHLHEIQKTITLLQIYIFVCENIYFCYGNFLM